MNYFNGENFKKTLTPELLSDSVGNQISFPAYVYQIRKGTGFSFVFLRCGRYVFQAVYIPQLCKTSISSICEGTYIKVIGNIKEEKRAPFGFEITLIDFEIISKPEAEFPLSVFDNALLCSLEANLKNRSVTLRRPDQRSILKITEGVCRAFSDFMYENDFTRIFPPSVCDITTNTQSNVFRLKYFGEDAFLTPDKQIYMQSGVAFFDRVFSVSEVFRADKHNSTRHINEFTSLDFELAFTDSIYDIINFIVGLLKCIIDRLNTNYSYELERCGCTLPDTAQVLTLTFTEALKTLGLDESKPDLDPTDCRYICEYAKKQNSDFVFITHYPSQKCPINFKDSDEKFSEGFILLCDGLDIAGGGLKINSFSEQLEKIKKYDLSADDYENYLKLHKYALPPHGGCSLGLERLVMKLLGLENVKSVSLFARDMHHLSL